MSFPYLGTRLIQSCLSVSLALKLFRRSSRKACFPTTFSSNTSFFGTARLSATFATWIAWIPERLYLAPPAVTSVPFVIQSSTTPERNGEGKCCLLYTSPSPRDGLLSR